MAMSRCWTSFHAFAGKRIDGHGPGLTGRELQAYVAAGIASDHECTTVEEANEKLRRGMYVMIREASNAHNLLTLLPIINQRTSRRVLFGTDDRLPDDLIDKGSIDYIVRTAIQHGLDPVTAVTIATLNASEYFGLNDRGAIAPGKRADIVVFNNFEEFKIERVYYGGQRVIYRGKLEPDDHERSRPPIRNTMNVDWTKVDLRVPRNRMKRPCVSSVWCRGSSSRTKNLTAPLSRTTRLSLIPPAIF